MVVVQPHELENPLDQIRDWWNGWMKSREEGKQLDIEINEAIIEHGVGMIDVWSRLAYEEPPEDFWGRLLWTAGIMGQLFISRFTFPAAIGLFLLEEAVQTYGMGAYMLATGDQWELADNYLDGQKLFIENATIAAKSLAVVSPVTGGSVLIYMDAAMDSWGAFKARAEIELQKALSKEENRTRIEDEATKYGTTNLRSSPSGAEIWINGENTELLTPETFKKMEKGDYIIELRKYSKQREVWDIYAFTLTVTPGRRKEIMIHIPETITGDEDDPDASEETDTPKLPSFIKAEVTGDRAIDGDTIQTTTGERIRILGIDTPETGRPYADLATEYTQSLIEDKKLTLQIQTHLPVDAYGRTLAIVTSYKGNIAILLLSAGLARAFIADDARYDPTRYLEAEQTAKTRRIGIWSELP